MNSIEKTVQGFVIGAATGALSAAGRAAGTDDAPIYAVATLDGKFLYVANAGTKATGVSGYRIDGLGEDLTPTEFATTEDMELFGSAVDATPPHVSINLRSVPAFTIDRAAGVLCDAPGTPFAIPETNTQKSSVSEFSVTASGLAQRMGPVPMGGYPVGIAADPAGRFVYVANRVSNDIWRYSISPEPFSTTAMPEVAIRRSLRWIEHRSICL